MLLSIFILPVLILICGFTYSWFKRHALSPWLAGMGAVGLFAMVFGGGIGWLGVCLVVPLFQVLTFSAFAWLYHRIEGSDLDEPPFKAFVLEGRAALAFGDTLTCLLAIVAPFMMFRVYDGSWL
jgi:hypothetical protein